MADSFSYWHLFLCDIIQDMDYIAWLTLFAVIVALGIGVASIVRTEKIQRREQKRRLLNEITEWAIKAVSWRSENRALLKEMLTTEEGEARQSLRLMHAHIAEVRDFFAAITGLNTYISKLSLKFQQGLPEVIQKLISDLEASTDFLEAWRGRLFADICSRKVDIDTSKDAAEADKLAEQFEKSAGAVLEKAADIKAKEIG